MTFAVWLQIPASSHSTSSALPEIHEFEYLYMESLDTNPSFIKVGLIFIDTLCIWYY